MGTPTAGGGAGGNQQRAACSMCRPSSSGWSGSVTDHQGSVMAWEAMVATQNPAHGAGVGRRAAHCAAEGSGLHCVSWMLHRMLHRSYCTGLGCRTRHQPCGCKQGVPAGLCRRVPTRHGAWWHCSAVAAGTQVPPALAGHLPAVVPVSDCRGKTSTG
jgi:hypothetical protein